MKHIAVLVAFCAVGLPCLADDGDALLATSNLWGVSLYEYQEAVGNVLRQVGPQSEIRCLWFADMCGYNEFPLSRSDMTWLDEKRKLMIFNLRTKVVSTSTNCWLAAADFLCRIKHSYVPELVELESLRAPGNLGHESLDGSASGALMSYLSDTNSNFKADWQCHGKLRTTESTLMRMVTNDFPRAILPGLAPSQRPLVISNIAERAAISQDCLVF